MKAIVFILMVSLFYGCKKDSGIKNFIEVPNGDFESWQSFFPEHWRTNSCPMCAQPLEWNIVRQDSTPYSGQFAAKLIFNGARAAYVENKFWIPCHPEKLTAYVKANINAGDKVSILIRLYSGATVVDSGYWTGNSSFVNYTKVDIPISRNSLVADSAFIRIEGGNLASQPATVLWVDNLTLH